MLWITLLRKKPALGQDLEPSGKIPIAAFCANSSFLLAGGSQIDNVCCFSVIHSCPFKMITVFRNDYLSSFWARIFNKRDLFVISRNSWIHALSNVAEGELKTAADKFKSRYTVRHRMLPEEGLGLLKMKDGALGSHYYLGEFPVASAHVELVDNHEVAAEGGAHVMHDSADYATDLAICDAALAGQLPGWEEIDRLLDLGMQKIAENERRRRSMLARTRVSFDLLSEVKEEHDDN